MTYQELGGPKESAFAGFLRIFGDSDFGRKLTHFRERLQNKEKNDPSRIEGFRFHYPFNWSGRRDLNLTPFKGVDIGFTLMV